MKRTFALGANVASRRGGLCGRGLHPVDLRLQVSH